MLLGILSAVAGFLVTRAGDYSDTTATAVALTTCFLVGQFQRHLWEYRNPKLSPMELAERCWRDYIDNGRR